MNSVTYIHGLGPGSIVGAGRWPEPLHEGLPPWKGVALAINDPLAWRGSALGDEPSQEAVDAHVKWCLSEGLLHDQQPVLWDFGDHSRVYWERLTSSNELYRLKPYEQDLALWKIQARMAQVSVSKAA